MIDSNYLSQQFESQSTTGLRYNLSDHDIDRNMYMGRL